MQCQISYLGKNYKNSGFLHMGPNDHSIIHLPTIVPVTSVLPDLSVRAQKDRKRKIAWDNTGCELGMKSGSSRSQKRTTTSRLVHPVIRSGPAHRQ